MNSLSRDVKIVTGALVLFLVALFIIFRTASTPDKTVNDQLVKDDQKKAIVLKSDKMNPALNTAKTARNSSEDVTPEDLSGAFDAVPKNPPRNSTLVSAKTAAKAETPADSSADYREYTVLSGEVITRILRKLGIPQTEQNLAKIREWNNLNTDYKIKAGQVLKLPK